MSRQEFIAWREYHRLFPFDDLHRYHRPAALVAHCAAGGGGADVLDTRLAWLAPEPAAGDGAYTEADLATFRAFGMKPPGRG